MYYILVLFLIIRLVVYCNMITYNTIFYSCILKGNNYIPHVVGLTYVKDKVRLIK